MDEIDVEPVDSVDTEPRTEVDAESRTAVDADLPTGIDAPEYVLYGGKGGVGKTTMAAATGLSSAAGGVETLVVSTDPAHSLSDTYGVDIPATPARVREDIPLYAVEIDPDDAIDDGMFGTEGDPLGGLGDLGEMAGGASGGDAGGMNGQTDPGSGPAGGLLGGTMPGADEAAAMRQLLEYLDDPRFDRVIVDTAPTGHTLRLLELPELMDSMIGRVMKLRQQFSGMMDGLTGLFGGGNDEPDPSEDLDALRDRIERLRAVLRDPNRTDFRIVMIPEEMSVVESTRLLDRLAEFGIPVETVVVNRVMEDLVDVADVDPEWVVSPNVEACAFCQRRWQVQQNALEQASDLFRGRTVKRVPLLGDAVHGDAALRVVAACLA